MKNLLKTLCLFSLCTFITPAYCAMTNSGTFNSTNSSAFMDILNTETGTLKGINSSFLKLTNKGIAILDHCTMLKEVTSFGTLLANDTQFQSDLTIHSGKTILTSCNLNSIYIMDREDENATHPIHITLDGSTLINGSIYFEIGHGKVYKSSNVRILGEIIGGQVIDLQD